MGTKFHRGFVGIPTDLSSDPSTCWLVMAKNVFRKWQSENSSGSFIRMK
ncbi:hypothetical protein LEP1GSC036_0058 [Leptospira weilii str. 2006001853]|uniref:Uncharacterized protein n=2 Tax=Leptospira weilii TaxID=28184 RepID=A0A828YY60_9LEPT|nr:hypothetical protein LEP1GSC036_0058 [Leptospira weilii str. 2006001853]EMM72653.1 hypothetical protein LEP1GSC038_1885 [Leptospira weilii str. 2006001855]EMN43806.1 hypothetical protein LEP1GSC086_4578 [Leptospira weilii str. LNT 1234]